MKDINSPLARFFKFWSPSLGHRLTVSFTLFGLLVGYFALVYLTISSTGTFIRVVSDIVHRQITSLSHGDPDGDNILKLINQKRDDITNAARFVQGVSSNLKFELYYGNKSGGWQRLYVDSGGVLRSEIIASAGVISSLERARREKITTLSPLFYGKGDNVHVNMNVSRKDSRNTYILSFNVHRHGILTLLNRQISKVAIFTILLVALSHVLGHLFSFWLVRPIVNLSREAAVIASGHYEHRFKIKERDEVGVLAESLNSMSSRIISSAKEREALLLGILIALTRAIDAKSKWTAGHSERVTRYAEEIGRALLLDEEQMRMLSISAILHDIGKIGVPEQILDKPGRLTDEEFSEIRKHPKAGTDIISSIPSYDGSILSGILYHHEHWDGTGYPEGLKGENIPLYARIICVADVYDALTVGRPYRKAWSREQAVPFFEEQKEKIFDPRLVDIFKNILSRQIL